MKLEANYFTDLIETRILLEIEATRIAAERRTIDDIISMQNALDAFQAKVVQGIPAIEEDLFFHLKIADAGQNPVLKSLMLVIAPDIIAHYLKLEVGKDGRFYRSLEEYKIILKHIINQEPELAAKAMKEHLKDVTEYRPSNRTKKHDKNQCTFSSSD